MHMQWCKATTKTKMIEADSTNQVLRWVESDEVGISGNLEAIKAFTPKLVE